ncbi:MAG TPA: CotS family spore coat protein [Clostridiaceae bacterium]|jgi:CotS family spore coat protein|nr:CotS family spore coat protein [Clostridiaceae bacterium]HBN29455.1 CotS family spore coat protein [Clostridiaceae bacterium]HCL51072.1 CotS family spore coat protein [Clostridiaceae bacterium]
MEYMMQEEYKPVSINSIVNYSDNQNIQKILSYYSIIPDEVVKIRSVYKIKYRNKYYCLKKLNHPNNKVSNGKKLVDILNSRGFYNTAIYIPTNDGRNCVRHKNKAYYITNWIDGRECKIDDFEELKKAISLLATFHIKSSMINTKELKLEGPKNWIEELKKQQNDIENYKRIISNKKILTSFDKLYLRYIDDFNHHLNLSIELLMKSNYLSMRDSVMTKHTICHDSYYYQNILVDSNGKLYIIDLESILYDVHVYDIAKFIRRIMYKKSYAWNFNYVKELIYEYDKISKLTKEDLEVLLAFLIVPHKFWKLGKKRYVKKKKWSEDKYLKKLYKYIKYIDKKNEFIKIYCDFYELNM